MFYSEVQKAQIIKMIQEKFDCAEIDAADVFYAILEILAE